MLNIIIKGVIEGIFPEEERLTTLRLEVPEVNFCKLQDTIITVQEELIRMSSTEKHPLKIKYVSVSYMDTSN